MAFVDQSNSFKKRGRDKVNRPNELNNKIRASNVVLPSKALGQKLETFAIDGNINDTIGMLTNAPLRLKTPSKKSEPKLSRSAQRRKSILAAEEANAAAYRVPILDHLPRPLPPTIISRTFHETVVQIHLITDLPPPKHTYKECDYQLQVSKGGKQLDSLKPPSSALLIKRRQKIKRGEEIEENESIPLSETKLKWSTIKRVPVSIPKRSMSNAEENTEGNHLRMFRLVGTYNVIEKCAFRCRIRYTDQGWSKWSRVSKVQIPVESGLPERCGRPIAFGRTRTSIELKWPAPSREILEYYIELASCRSNDNIPQFDMEDELRKEDLPSDDDNSSDNEDDEIRKRILKGSKNDHYSHKNPVLDIQRKVLKLDWIAATHLRPTKNEVTLHHLQPSKSYRFRVRGRNSIGWGLFGPSSDSYKLAPNPPGTPLKPVVIDGTITPRTATLQWNEPRLNGSKNIEGWDVAIATNDDGWVDMDPTIVNTLIGNAYWCPNDRAVPEPLVFDDDDDEASNQSVVGDDDDEEEEEENSVSTTRTKSTKVASNSGSASSNRVKLTWRPLKQRIKCDSKRLSTGDLNKYCTYTFHGLAPTSPYQFRVRAFCATGNGGWSIPSSLFFTTKENFDIRAIVWEAKTNGVQALVNLMTNPQFLDNPNVQTRCIRSLRLIAANKDDNGIGYNEVLNTNVLNIMIDSLTNNNKDPSLLRWSCRMYSVYWNVIDINMLEIIIKHSLQLIDVVAVAQWSCSLLRILIDNKKQIGITELLSKIPGSLDIPLLTAKKHSSRAALFTESLKCLNSICSCSLSMCKIACEKKGIDIVKVAALQQFGSTKAEELAKCVVKTLLKGVVNDNGVDGSRPGSRAAVRRNSSMKLGDEMNIVDTKNEGDHDCTIKGKNNSILLDSFEFTPSTFKQQRQQYSKSMNQQNDQQLQKQLSITAHHHLQMPNTLSNTHKNVNYDDTISTAPSIATSARSIGSLRSRLHQDEIEVFEWIEAQIHRKKREVGLDSDEDYDHESIDPLFWTEEEKQKDRHKRHKLKHDQDNHP